MGLRSEANLLGVCVCVWEMLQVGTLGETVLKDVSAASALHPPPSPAGS